MGNRERERGRERKRARKGAESVECVRRDERDREGKKRNDRARGFNVNTEGKYTR